MKQTVSGLQNWPLPIWSAKDWVLGGALGLSFFIRAAQMVDYPHPHPPSPSRSREK